LPYAHRAEGAGRHDFATREVDLKKEQRHLGEKACPFHEISNSDPRSRYFGIKPVG
jgi:hypothetical protein